MFKNKMIRLAAIPAAVLVSVGSAHAAADAAFTGAITSVTTDIGLYGAALVGVAAVGVTFMIAMKYVKKIRSAA